jgi:hypothetical protein
MMQISMFLFNLSLKKIKINYLWSFISKAIIDKRTPGITNSRLKNTYPCKFSKTIR